MKLLLVAGLFFMFLASEVQAQTSATACDDKPDPILSGLQAYMCQGQKELVAQQATAGIAFRHWMPLAAQGNAAAEYQIGILWDSGFAGAKGQSAADPVKAFTWYQRAAKQGYALAEAALGFDYIWAVGTSQNLIQGADWEQLAAKQGDASAEFQLGDLYENGSGVIQDYIKAYTWLDLATANLSPGINRDLAVKDRNAVALRMTPSTVLQAQALAAAFKSTITNSSAAP